MKWTIFWVAAVSLAAQDWAGSAAVDKLIETAMAKEDLPGAVVLVGQPGRVLHRKAYGQRSLKPEREAMTLDTIFDAASLTKVVATTSAIMKLVEQGQIRLNDPVTRYLPEFQAGKSEITARHLLTHTSGLRPDLDLEPVWSGYDTGIQKALVDKPVAEPNARFIYSDINFELLGEMVRRLSGKPLEVFVREQVFQPLGMADSGFNPAAALRGRIAPTEQYKGMSEPLRGVVHDPTARYMGGVAGHAGLFTTADDLAKFCEMMLGEGERAGVRVFSPLTVARFTSGASPAGLPVRGLGWDVDSPYAGQRGDLFPPGGGYGHTGFTGTSIWVDKATKTYVLLLTNASVHPVRRPAITSLRGRLASVVAANLQTAVAANSGRREPVLTGLDVLSAEGFARLKGKRIGLATNHTGINAKGERNVDLMVKAGVQLVALFSPEHGIAGKEDHEKVASGKDAATGLPVYSLYEGTRRKPTPEMLKGLDALVFDIQDIGARFYTYPCTMKNTMEAAAENHLPFVVLDRPNPITGEHVEGPMLDEALQSFVGCEELPLRHGMTMGELARMMNAKAKTPAELSVVEMKGWRRSDWMDEAGMTWVNPSPSMKSLNAALLYPGIAMIEYSKNWSVGRGTDAPFEQVGAAWLDGPRLAAYLNGRGIPGVKVYATRFTPSAYYFANQAIDGVRFVVTDRNVFDSTRLGLELCAALQELHPGKIDFSVNAKLIGNAGTVGALGKGEGAEAIRRKWREGLAKFRQERDKYLLYR